ncbi:MAG: DUF2961 domain-containing protein [Ruminococcaceae bacterium]|nr:DUF2961 domain-containing protein [Oscillospiraceae bacterium]
MIYEFKNSEPRWITFENPKGEKGKGAMENNGAKGHPAETFPAGSVKTLCDFDGCGIVRRIWITVNERAPEILKNIRLRMYWDNAAEPQVDVPLCDFFCMGLGEMRPFENRYFTTAEGRSFCCTIPMPFRRHAKITLANECGTDIRNLFYDIDLTLEALSDAVMYFHADFTHIPQNELEKDVTILNCTSGGRYLGASIAIYPDNGRYKGLWWGEGEIKMYIDGDTDYPTVVGTGAEDYTGSAWGLGEFINRDQGCANKKDGNFSFYRFHVEDAIYFKENIRVTLQTIGGGEAKDVITLAERGVPHTVISYDSDCIHGVYGQDYSRDGLAGWVNFYRQDEYRIVAYYYTAFLS